MTTPTKRTRKTVKTLATVGAAGVAVMAVGGQAAWATASGNHTDASGNLVNTEIDLHCNAKIESGFHPPAIGFDGHLLVTNGGGDCKQGTTFDHGIVDIQQNVNGNWTSLGAVTFTTQDTWTQAYTTNATGNTGAVCLQYRARTRVWRRADRNNANPTISVLTNSVWIGNGGVCDKV